MNRILFALSLLALLAVTAIAPAAAQVGAGREAALDYIGRGTAAFRNGDIIAATREWSDAIRLCRLSSATDVEAQAYLMRANLSARRHRC